MSHNSKYIEIGKNWIRYYSEELKISNISRTWIFKFQNKERKAYENAMRNYEDEKRRYLETENRKKQDNIRNYTFAAVVIVIISIFIFSLSQSILPVLASLVGAGIFGYMAYLSKNKSVVFEVAPPVEKLFPDKFGLGIEMNTGYHAIFTAIGDDGKRSLGELQKKISDADMQKEITNFNMYDNRITVENMEGIVSVGENAENTIINKKDGKE